MKLDLKKEFKSYYSAFSIPSVVEFESCNYLTILGKGTPGGKEFVEKTQALFPMAYGIKKICKSLKMDFAVAPLEAQWWVEGKKTAEQTPRSEWYWKLMIRIPDFVTSKLIETARIEVIKKKKSEWIKLVEFESMHESRCVQMLHVGSYSDEEPTVQTILKFVDESGFIISGKHHEVYLSDPRKTSSDKLKTIIRYPIR